MQHASLTKRFAAMLYEALSLIAIWLLCTLIFILLFGAVDTASKRFMLQVFLWVLTGGYFVACWIKTGQTLAMQAWKIKLMNANGQCLSVQQALLRYSLVTISLAAFGLGFLWAFVDKEQLFLHDRILSTYLAKSVNA